MVFLCANTCVVYAPAAVVAHEKSRVLSFLEEAVDFGKLSAVQFVPRGLIRLTFKDPVDKERLVSQGSIMLDNGECDVTPSDRPNTMVYVHHYPAEGGDTLLCAEFRCYSKIVSVKHQYFSGRPNLLTGNAFLRCLCPNKFRRRSLSILTLLGSGIAVWLRFARFARQWDTKPLTVNIT